MPVDLSDCSRREIVEADRRHLEVQQQLEKREEERQTIHQTYATIKEEVDDKRAQRDRLAKKLKKLAQKKLEATEEHLAAREELEAEQREIQKRAKLFQVIIENFIPADERERLLKRMQLDASHSSWTLKELSKET